ncbi:hypothetical protein KCU71_g227, partial [Aureobasidium melanogenum]
MGTVIYTVIGNIVYYICGSYVASPALGSAGVTMKKVCYGLALPGLCIGTVLLCHLPAKYVLVRILRGSKYLTSNTKTHWITWLSCTTGITLISYIIASAIPVFGGLVSLVGALFATLLSLAQRRKNFFCIDLSNDNAPVKLETTKGGKRSGYISLELGGIDDEYFRTLVPEKPVDFTASLIVATRPNKPLVAGHRYRFGTNEGESILYWYKGTREQIMSPPGQDAPAAKDMRTILLDLEPPVEFEVLETQHSGHE